MLLAIFACLVVVDTTALGFSIATQETQETILSYALRVVFDIYLLILVSITVHDKQVPHHWVTIIHLSSLIGLSLFISGLETILPETPDVVVKGDKNSVLLDVLWYTDLALSFIATAIVITIPRGPKLHFPSEAIYSEKTLETSTTHSYENVCGISG